MEFELGDIFYLDVSYEDNPNESKRRPVIIVQKDVYNLLMLVSTPSKPPRIPPKYHDQFKIPIINWRKYGFTKPSWVLCYRLIELPEDVLKNVVKKEDYIGRMNPYDFNGLLSEIERIHKE